jgi:hypothetical protein
LEGMGSVKGEGKCHLLGPGPGLKLIDDGVALGFLCLCAGGGHAAVGETSQG